MFSHINLMDYDPSDIYIPKGSSNIEAKEANTAFRS